MIYPSPRYPNVRASSTSGRTWTRHEATIVATATARPGKYNAVQGDTDAVFDVWCDNGDQGTARMVRDKYGRDGVGVVKLDDGTEGRIVFGPMVAEVARSALRR